MAEADAQMAEVRRLLDVMARAIRQGSNATSDVADELEEYSDQLVDLNTSIKREQKRYEKQLDDLTWYTNAEREERKKQLLVLNRKRLDAMRELKLGEQLQKERQNEVYFYGQMLKARQRALEATEDTDTYAHHQAEIEAITEKLSSLKTALKGYDRLSSSVAKIDAQMKREEDNLKGSNLSGVLKGAADKFASLPKAIISKIPGIAGAVITGLTTTAYKTIQANMATGIALSVGAATRAVKDLGMTPTEYTEFIAANRRSILAAGGIERNAAILKKGSDELIPFVGDQKTAVLGVQEQMTMLARSGIRPAIKDTQLLSQSFLQLQKTSGMQIGEFNQHVAEMIESDEVQASLKAAATEDERRRIVASNAARLAEYAAMGMTTEQAKAASKTLNRLAGEGPLERLKKAAQLRMLGGAMGISGSEGAAAILRKGEAASGEEKAVLADFLKRVSNEIALAQGRGDLAREIQLTSLIKNIDIPLGKTSELTTTAAQAVAPTIEAVKSLGDVSDGLKDVVKSVNRAATALEAAAKTLTGTDGGILGTLATAAGGIGGALVGGAVVGASRLFRGRRPAPSRGPTGTTIEPPQTARGPTGGPGGPAGSSGSRMGGWFDKFKGTSGMKSMLGAGARKLPFIGLGLAGMDAMSNFGAGNTSSGLLNIASGLASMIPGIGTAASFGIDALASSQPTASGSVTELNPSDGLAADIMMESQKAAQTMKSHLDVATTADRRLETIAVHSQRQVELMSQMVNIMAMSEEDRKKYLTSRPMRSTNAVDAQYVPLGSTW